MAMTHAERQAAYRERGEAERYDYMRSIKTIARCKQTSDGDKVAMIKNIVSNYERRNRFDSE